jgi:catechol 2,3-dioxygenase-like lactoylglutathione lyase family enzyme
VIHHVTFEVRRELGDRCAAFYRLLGFEPVPPPDSLAERAAWFERRGTQIHLMWVDEPVTLPEGHVAIVPDDYERTLDALRDAGHAVEERQRHWGAPRASARDPGGNRVELMAFPPGGRT